MSCFVITFTYYLILSADILYGFLVSEEMEEIGAQFLIPYKLKSLCNTDIME